MFCLCFINSLRYPYENFVSFFAFQSNCYSRVITVDGQKKIIIFASRRYQNLSFCFLSSYKFRFFPYRRYIVSPFVCAQRLLMSQHQIWPIRTNVDGYWTNQRGKTCRSRTIAWVCLWLVEETVRGSFWLVACFSPFPKPFRIFHWRRDFTIQRMCKLSREHKEPFSFLYWTTLSSVTTH